MKTVSVVLAVVLGAQVLLKFVFFALPYPRRRAALDRAYGSDLTATATSDFVSLLVVVGLAVVLFVAGVNPVSFLTGLWIGATLIQLYFHRFHAPLASEHAPLPPAGPIKVMSYAIQATPWRPWREVAALTVLIIAAFVALATN